MQKEFLYIIIQLIIYIKSMKSQVNKNNWNDSMHIFFSPKLNIESRNGLPQIVDSAFYQR